MTATPFFWAWVLWHLCWLAGFVPVPMLFGSEIAAGWFVALYTCFVPLEIAGVWRNNATRDGVPRTLSEFRELVAERSRNQPGFWDDFLSWKGVAGFSGVADAVVMGVIVGSQAQGWMVPLVGPEYAPPVGACVGLVWGLGIAVWLIPHLGWNEWVG